MSYSRWSNSRWYTYWSASGGETKDEQLFDICGTANFTYSELKQDIEACLDKVVAIENESCDKYGAHNNKVTSLERDELKFYMNQFIGAVEREYDVQAEPDTGKDSK